MRQSLTRHERQVATTLYECLFGGLSTHSSAEVGDWLDARVQQAGFEVACGVRLALLVVWLSPLWLVAGLRTFLGHERREQHTGLERLAESRSYGLRQLLIMLKAVLALHAGRGGGLLPAQPLVQLPRARELRS